MFINMQLQTLTRKLLRVAAIAMYFRLVYFIHAADSNIGKWFAILSASNQVIN